MSDLALSVRGLTKEYQILHNAERQNRVTDAVADSVKGLFRKKDVETFRALDDVSFDVKKGEVLGVIGRNGAGKSTLLKILSRITEPTSGEIHLYGRVGSLLEVGTGFHPELTGRENIYLNGAILGMRKKEIDRKFDAIVDFAEVEKFLDTPVKRYSSGMYVRLAFAVAAHLNPEILIVDEVLAVGDAQFQKKCLGKMQDVSRQDGRTVLFVSHNMAAITSLCSTAIQLQSGRLAYMGACHETVTNYVADGSTRQNETVVIQDVNSQKKLCFRSISCISSDGTAAKSFDVRYPIGLRMEYQVNQQLAGIELSVRVDRIDGHPVFTSHLTDCTTGDSRIREVGTYTSYVEIPGLFLMPDDYLVTVAAHMPMGEIFDLHEQVIGFTVADTGTNFAAYNNYRGMGTVLLNVAWQTTDSSEVIHESGYCNVF